MEKFVFETKINHIEDNSLLLVCADFFYVLAVTTRLQEANWYQGRSKKYGEFKTIQNEGESTVWRYFCLVVNADLLNLDGWGREMNVKTDKLGQRQKHLRAENNGFQT